MSLFKIDCSISLNEIGEYPQIQRLRKGYDEDKKNSCRNIGRYFFGRKPDLDIDFDGLEIQPKAKVTDYLSASYLNPLTGMLISKPLFEFIKNIKVVEYLSYEATIYNGNTLINKEYRWLHFISIYSEFISFKESIFYVTPQNGKKSFLKISSLNDYSSLKSKSEYEIKTDLLILKKDIINHFQIFRLGTILYDTIVTKEVKEQMEKEGFTGIDFKQMNHINLI